METLLDEVEGDSLPLPDRLRAFYGPLRFPAFPGRPWIFGNFVSTLDGVVDLGMPGEEGGGAISGHDARDRALMGILRAAADAVIVGAGTLRSLPGHRWTPEHAFPDLSEEYGRFREALGRKGPPLTVIVTERGDLDPTRPVFRSPYVPVLIVTGREGSRRIREHALPPSVRITVVDAAGPLAAESVVEAVRHVGPPPERLLLEGGPRLMGYFLSERLLDELFLTLAPQVAGREGSFRRPGLVDGVAFTPGNARRGTLASVRRAGSHLFFRYAFGSAPSPPG